MRIAFGVEYDGTNFCGWQTQTGVRTVQSCVEEALSTVANHSLSVVCAGRTDTGVHATGQVFHTDVQVERTMRSWILGGNANLPSDIVLLWAKPVNNTFHARFSANARHYRYIIFNRHVRPAIMAHRTTWERRPLDVTLMGEAANYLRGTHDFSAYRASSCQARNPTRTISRLQILRQANNVIIDITANAFLQHMVRNIAGVLIKIGSGEAPPTWADEVLRSKDRTLGGVTAPPSGLYFRHVDYPLSFQLPDCAAESPNNPC